MTPPLQVEINQFDFNEKLFDNLSSNHFVKNLWPLVYIISDNGIKEAYVGETTDTYTRMNTHMKTHSKGKLTSVRLITSDKFNKSATLDIESNLIKYMSGDGEYKLINGNLGLANHNYYQKQEIYWGIFNTIWNQLRSTGLVKHSIEHINNSDLFKYSPYKNLTNEQSESLWRILESLDNKNSKNIIVEGGAGTGKTILAIFLFKMLSNSLNDFNFNEFGDAEQRFFNKINEIKSKNPSLKMALVVPMSSFRSTLKKVFKNIKGLNAKMVIGPAEVSKEKYDIIVVDESHRLRRRINLGTYFSAFDKVSKQLGFDKLICSELDWVLKQSDKAVFFYDEGQSIKPSDVRKIEFDKLKARDNTVIQTLKSQLRVKGGNSYIDFVDSLLLKSLQANNVFNSKDYELVMFESIEEMINTIKKRDRENGLSRLIAGYSWKWVSKNNPKLYDIKIDEVDLMWNGTSNDWINSENSINEVGCIHTTQGYDLNYAGIIFGNEISYDKVNNQIIIKENNYFDRNGLLSIKDSEELKTFILNIYNTLMKRAIKGTYVYVCDPDLRDYFRMHINTIGNKQEKEIVENIENLTPFVNCVPLYDLKAAAGSFSSIQTADIEKWVRVPEKYKGLENLFACHVVGESMNKIIPNGAICLFRKYSGGSRNGLIVLAESTEFIDSEFGSSYTVKEYESSKFQDEDGWKHESITLKPLSTIDSYNPIILKDDAIHTFKIIGTFESVLSAK